MQVVKLQEPYDDNLIPDGPVVLCLGFFDGVHRGHQAVILEGRRRAEKLGARLAVMTLDRYPGIVFNNEENRDFAYLSSERRKLELFERLGVDICYVVSFDEKFYTLSQQDFVEKYIVSLHAVCAVAGSDYTYGKMPYANGGDMSHLKGYARGRFEVVRVSHILDGAEKISSTRIRKALKEGDVRLAEELLGYPYETSGQVVHGFERGRKLGFPTLNIETREPVMIPSEGVYAVFVRFEGEEKRYMGMASIGRNETFGNHFEKTVEINLLDFSDMVYGKTVFIEWIELLRGMKKFGGADELIDQLNHDRKRTRRILEKRN
ncbi:riboflavin biosynthesis protein RibF [Ligilactobacillus sp.]|uniref:riboflavin biosynthesis protein RibF n=1 Tax=Ligilactobacillus sp. TaxID=2767921 RepID=UPI002FDF0E59